MVHEHAGRAPEDRVSETGTIVVLAMALSLAGCAEGSSVDDPEPTPDAGSSNPCVQEPNLSTGGDTCDNSVHLGTLSDAAGDMELALGNAVAGVEVWFSFGAPDDTDTAGDEYHVDVRFRSNPSDGYAFDVYRDGCTPDAQIATEEAEVFDWYTDFPATETGCTISSPCGEGDCAPAPGEEGKNTCGDDSATFYLRVFRPDGAASCDAYELEVSNGHYEST
jgi:hypothetical protein